ncbi:GtrA family protein [Aeromicrobium sp. A1-2]|uniref:GtrA family protein n=1 Tax=Aeromicrobium sp. A1-2 TaxID=2107713 RepID=UPI000E4BDCC9|nr:GtrA family protein [Aeromicrobium sp. A1-2]AXT86901.1 GtrA family protein [Aeromicrobium sp. A1-2]
MSRPSGIVARLMSPEILSFLAVGGFGYVVDVGVFNYLRTAPLLVGLDPSVAKSLAVALAMVVTYVGNRAITWRGEGAGDRRREVMLFVLFNLVGLGVSVLTLVISHDLLGLTSRLADNLSANVVGLALGTAFRYWSYRRYVFGSSPGADNPRTREASVPLAG